MLDASFSQETRLRNTRTTDRLWLVVAMAAWAVCFAFAARTAFGPGGFPPIVVRGAQGASDHPRVARVPDWGPEILNVRPGDSLLRLGETDLAGAGSLDFIHAFERAARTEPRVTVEIERGGSRQVATVAAGSHALFRPLLLTSLAFAACAAWLLLRAPPSPLVRAFFLAFMTSAFFFAGSFFGSRLETYLSFGVHTVAMSLVAPLHLRAFQRFPHDSPPAASWSRAWPWLFAVLGPLHASRFGVGLTPEIGGAGAATAMIGFWLLVLALAARDYRNLDAVGRRQVRWFLYGLYLATAPPLFCAGLAAWDDRFYLVYVYSLASLAFIPAALLISIARFNLFDVDRLISVTTSYNTLIVLLVATGVLIVPGVSAAGSLLLGVDQRVGQIVVSLGLAAFAVPAQRWLRSRIDRKFFAERWAIDRGAERLLRELQDSSDPRELLRRLGEGAERLLRPERCAIYASAQGAYVPVFTAGRAVPAAFEADGPLIATLRRRRAPLALGKSRRGGADPELGPFDRAVLESLDAEVVLPIWRGDELYLVLCLGPRRSGDTYTPTDVHLLATLADRVSLQLLTFDQREMIEESRKMQEALRRYVPGAVLGQLEQGTKLERGVCEVSVMFVDLRGYVGLSEDRAPQEIFATLTGYTKTVSDVVIQHGGQLVDFSGDGVMAVFGAPQPLREKERAALAAARAVVEAVGRLPSPRPDGAPLAAGVGVASGPAFVGTIGAADRTIWSVVGNTTNLAARLQALTRELDASIAIDAGTRQGAGDAADDLLRREGVVIRGRRRREDVYLLPRSAPA
jgi:class 3 adenylate cyclase